MKNIWIGLHNPCMWTISGLLKFRKLYTSDLNLKIFLNILIPTIPFSNLAFLNGYGVTIFED